MITVHHLEASRSHRIVWLLEEMGLPYHLQIHRREASGLAPAALGCVHPLGKSPVLVDGDETVAESAAIIEYIAERYGSSAPEELAHLEPARNTQAHRMCRYWMHFAEGSLMNWLVMGLVFAKIPQQPMPFFVRPVAKGICSAVRKQLIAPNVQQAMAYMEQHLTKYRWFAGDAITMADFQMGFAVEAGLSSFAAEDYPHLRAYLACIQARPAYQSAIKKAGAVLPSV
jgi:glutathione S-transferase